MSSGRETGRIRDVCPRNPNFVLGRSRRAGPGVRFVRRYKSGTTRGGIDGGAARASKGKTFSKLIPGRVDSAETREPSARHVLNAINHRRFPAAAAEFGPGTVAKAEKLQYSAERKTETRERV